MRGWRGVAVLLTVGLALVIAASGCTPKVPNVVGMPFDQAVKTLQDAGYKLGTTSYGYTSNIAPATVARQTPAADSSLRRGGTVALLVTQPLGSLTTPNLVGQTQQQAESALTTFSLTASPAEDYSASVAKGVVISQAPPAGALINPGDTVAFVVSKGPAPAKVTVPAINGKKQADAEAALKAAGLVPAPYQAYSNSVAVGVVSSQSPGSGVSVSPGSTVNFVVSLGKGTTTVTIPIVVGKTQSAAETALKNVGLVPSVATAIDAKVPKGTVSRQSPAAGATTAKGAVVGIVVSLGPDTSASVPNVVGMASAEASAAIIAAGLVPDSAEQPDGSVPAGTVLSQAPAGGTRAEIGTTVLYTVSSGVPKPPK